MPRALAAATAASASALGIRASCRHHASAPAASRPRQLALQRVTLATSTVTSPGAGAEAGPGCEASPTRMPRHGHPLHRSAGASRPSQSTRASRTSFSSCVQPRRRGPGSSDILGQGRTPSGALVATAGASRLAMPPAGAVRAGRLVWAPASAAGASRPPSAGASRVSPRARLAAPAPQGPSAEADPGKMDPQAVFPPPWARLATPAPLGPPAAATPTSHLTRRPPRPARRSGSGPACLGTAVWRRRAGGPGTA